MSIFKIPLESEYSLLVNPIKGKTSTALSGRFSNLKTPCASISCSFFAPFTDTETPSNGAFLESVPLPFSGPAAFAFVFFYTYSLFVYSSFLVRNHC